MTKNRTKKTKRTIKRSDRFLRVKNKSEVVYRVPVFLKKSVGMLFLSESGTLETDGRLSRAYVVDNNRIGVREEKLKCLQIDYAFVFRKSNPVSMLLSEKMDCGYDEITKKFSDIESELQIKSMSADERMAYYCNFLKNFLGIQTEVNSYILDSDCWKQVANMEGLKISDNRILIPESCYCVLAVRKIKKNTSWKDLDNLVNDPVVKSMYIAVSGVSDRQIKESLCSEYMGIEGMASRMKRNAPELYEILQKDADADTVSGKYRRVSIYFLMQTEVEQVNEKILNFIKNAYKTGIKMERMALSEQKNIPELKRTLAMFGMTGNSQERYRMLVTEEQVQGLLNIVTEEKKQEKYDIEKMKALFYDGVNV